MRLKLRDTLYLRAFGLFKVPLIFFLRPTVQELSEERVVIRIPLSYRSKNHLGSMYFGVLCVGADCAGGILAMKLCDASPGAKKAKPSLVFKDFHAEFLKRPTGDVDFVCEDGKAIKDMVDAARRTGERQNLPVAVVAKVASEEVAKFTLTLSVKFKS